MGTIEDNLLFIGPIIQQKINTPLHITEISTNGGKGNAFSITRFPQYQKIFKYRKLTVNEAGVPNASPKGTNDG